MSSLEMSSLEDTLDTGPQSTADLVGEALGAPGDPRAVWVTIPVAGAELVAELVVPDAATGIVLFAHGSSSGLHHPRNRFVARTLQQAGLATMLIDLLAESEDEVVGSRLRVRFVDLLASRLVEATRWTASQPFARGFDIGYFGSNTGAAAAIVAALRSHDDVKAVVCRAARTDLTEGALDQVRAATLLIASSDDPMVLDLNRKALTELRCMKRLEIVPGSLDAPHAVEKVATLAQTWFGDHLGGEVTG